MMPSLLIKRSALSPQPWAASVEIPSLGLAGAGRRVFTLSPAAAYVRKDDYRSAHELFGKCPRPKTLRRRGWLRRLPLLRIQADFVVMTRYSAPLTELQGDAPLQCKASGLGGPLGLFTFPGVS